MNIQALYDEYVPWQLFQELFNIEHTLYERLYQNLDDDNLLEEEHNRLNQLQTLSEKCNISRCSIPLVAQYIAALPHSDIVDKENAHIHRLSILYEIRKMFLNQGFQKIEQIIFPTTHTLTLRQHLAQWGWNTLIQKVILMLMIDNNSFETINTVLSHYQTYLNTRYMMNGGGSLDMFSSVTSQNINLIAPLFQNVKKQLTTKSNKQDIYNIYVMEHFWKTFVNLFQSDELKYLIFIKLIEGLQESEPIFIQKITHLLRLPKPSKSKQF